MQCVQAGRGEARRVGLGPSVGLPLSQWNGQAESGVAAELSKHSWRRPFRCRPRQIQLDCWVSLLAAMDLDGPVSLGVAMVLNT